MKKNIGTTIFEYLAIAFGTFLVAFALQFFFFPNKIASGGVTGLALIISSIFHISSSLIVTISNVILFLIAFVLISGEFGTKSIYAAGLLSVFLAILESFFGNVVITNDLVLATVIGSFLLSGGTTIIFLYEASTGGTTIVGKILSKYFHISIGMSLFIADAVVAVLSIFAFNMDLALYGLITVFLTGYLVDVFIGGFISYKQVMIVTNQKEKVLNYILKVSDRGCTILEGTGGYSKERKDILMTVLTKSQFVTLRKFLKEEDETAFVTVTDVKKVFGEGFEQLH